MAKNRKFNTDQVGDQDKVIEFGNKKKFHVNDLVNLQFRNPRQEQFWDLWNDDQKEIIFLRGAAGTGKTFISYWAAAYDVFEGRKSKIVGIRSNQTVRKEGFLPGDQDQKNFPLEAPYKAIFDEIIRTYKNNYDNLKALGYYEFMTSSYIRGTTIHDAIMIVDEVQNMDYEELLSVITRAGENTRVILIGDERQDDLARVRQISGLVKMKSVLEQGMPHGDLGVVDFKIEDAMARSPLVGKIISADYYYGGDDKKV